MFIGRTDVEAEASTLWPPDTKSRLVRKGPDVGKDRGQEEKGATEDEMVGWHRWLDGHEFKEAPVYGEGQGSLVCCSPWGHGWVDTAEWLNNNITHVCLWKGLSEKCDNLHLYGIPVLMNQNT